MKSAIAPVCSILMIAYVLFEMFTKLLFLPMVASISSPYALYCVAFVIGGVTATVVSFTRFKRASAFLAIALAIIAIGHWLPGIRNSQIAEAYFIRYVLPDLLFGSAAWVKWKFSGYSLIKETAPADTIA